MKFQLFFVALWSWKVLGLATTDSLMDADSSQSGYLPNHNMDPNIIAGGSFGQIWTYKNPNPGSVADQYYAKPLVYTPSNYNRQVVLAFSEANRIYVLDAINGTLITMRDLSLEGEGPFKVTDLSSCNDIGQNIGITGTPVIDPTTNTVYFWAKSYLVSGVTGLLNGVYKFHAVDTVTLVEKPGFPTTIQGAPADNDATRLFHGGTHLQRASLNLVNGVVVAGFGGHCDLYNYTGWVVGMSSSSGKLLSAYAASGGVGAPPQDGTWTGGGGGCGVWQGGAAIASDNTGRIFFATGNAKNGATVNQQVPASGRVHLSTLSEAIVNMAVDPDTGILTQQDYFEPSTYIAMDGGDRDLGGGGVCLPDPTVFTGGGVTRLAMSCGKNGVCFITNADNLGGFKMAANGGDSIIQTLTPPGGGAIFAGPGSYPGEGGYIYITPVGYPTYCYALGFDTNQRPAFTLVGQTSDSSPGAVGAGPATITTLNGQAGTGILWVADTNGLRAYGAVPVNGILPRITIPVMPAPPKFSRPTFGDGRYYMGTFSGSIVAFGAPVALPLTCVSPLDFGSLGIGSTAVLTASCTANIATTLVGLVISNSIYKATNASLPQTALVAGQKFTFSVTFDLSTYVLSAGSTSAPTVTPGVQSAALTLLTKNAVVGYSVQQSISLTGTVVSQNPWLSINPLQVDFPGLVVGSADEGDGSTSTFIIQNIGKGDMIISGYAFSTDQDATYTNVTVGATTWLGPNGYFTSDDLPAIGTKIVSGGSVTISATFSTTVVGSFYLIFNVFSNGGQDYVILSGAANTLPVALLEQSTSEGGWITIPDCAIPADGCTTQINIGSLTTTGSILQTLRITNKGGSDLTITKSKPPEGDVLGASNPTIDFSEGLAVIPGSSVTASVYFQPGASTLNSDPTVYSGAWTLNTDDLNFGVHVLNFTGTLSPPQVGPLLTTGNARYKRLGCFMDGAAARIEPTSAGLVPNSNGQCQQSALTAGYIFAGTEYTTQCWIGNVVPLASAQVADSLCTTYICPGDTTQYCGGFGGYLNLFYDSLKYLVTTPVASSAPTSTKVSVPSSTKLTTSSTKVTTSSVVVPISASSTRITTSSTTTSASRAATSSTVPSTGGYTYVGCYTDTIALRTLVNTGNVGVAATNSMETCAASCVGYTLFGMEYGTECYCGNAILNGATSVVDTLCDYACPGNLLEFCGAPSRLSIYSYSNAPVLSSAKTSSTTSQSSSSSSKSSVISIISPVKTSTSSSSTIVKITSTSTKLSTTSTSTSIQTTSSTKTTLTTSSTKVATTSSIPLWSYAGCANDTSGNRALTNVYTYGPNNTIENCQATCLAAHYPLAGLEASNQCFCGLSLSYNSSVGQTGCTAACTGNSSQICGGPQRLSVYQQNNFAYPVVVPVVGAYKIAGCYVDATDARVLGGYTYMNATGMTVQACAATCAVQGGGSYWGLEYATQCFCGTAIAAGSVVAPITDCMVSFCSGNATQYCGAAGRLLLYST